jgi:hypothetical protein
LTNSIDVEKLVGRNRDVFLGKKLGSGATRIVYRARFNDNCVVKIEETSRRWFQNVLEYCIWEEIKYDKEMRKWFAPCHDISADGSVLIMAYCKDIPENKRLPTKVPKYLNDVDRRNFGIYQNKLVCRDYGICLGAILDNQIKKERKVVWSPHSSA